MSRPYEEPEACEGREAGPLIETPEVTVGPLPEVERPVRLWTVWDHYQSAVIEGLSQP